MNQRGYRTYLVLFLILIALLCLPLALSENLRSRTIAILAPVWGLLTDSKLSLADSSQKNLENKIQKLQLENQRLKSHLIEMSKLFHEERFLDDALEGLQSEVKKHHDQTKQRVRFHFQSLPAQVIYRTPSAWNSSFWINIGKKDNPTNEEVVAKNSPVVLGNCLIGVVDYVGEQQSRVRLLTDAGLNPSVRAVRGDLQRCFLSAQISAWVDQMELKYPSESRKDLVVHLEKIREILADEKDGNSWFLAKGELRGKSQPMWRSQGNLLRGIGFNYDFADEEGAARDLRTGAPQGSRDAKNIPIIQKDDLLITTGMDGVFPAGLFVAEVTRVNPLREGDYYYEIEARPAAGSFQELTTVFVMPPLHFDKDN